MQDLLANFVACVAQEVGCFGNAFPGNESLGPLLTIWLIVLTLCSVNNVAVVVVH